jgi:phosphate transport system permease protein
MAQAAAGRRAVDPGVLMRRRVTDVVMRWLMGTAVAVAVLPLALLLLYVLQQGLPALSLDVLTSSGSPSTGGGFAHAIVGSAIILLIAILIGIPWGILVGVYLAEFSEGTPGRAVRFFSDVLTGVPTIVTGLVVYGLLVLGTGNFSAWAGGVALGLIMAPIVTRSTEEMLNLVPDALREAALALGMPKWKVVVRIVLPTAMAGIITGALLAIARASGETAPILVTTLGSNFLVTSLDQPIMSLPLYVYQNAAQFSPRSRELAWAACLVLIAFVLLLSLTARLIGRRSKI